MTKRPTKNLEYEQAGQAGKFKRYNTKNKLIALAIAAVLLVGYLSTINYSPTVKKETETPFTPKDNASQTEAKPNSAAASNDAVKTQDIPQFKPLNIKDSHGNEYYIMKIWYREDLFFTQGFTLINQNKILESTGLNRQSFIHYLLLDDKKQTALVDPAFKKSRLEDIHFGEGNDILQGKTPQEKFIYYLTWQTRKIFKYDINLNQLGSVELPSEIKEGWGMTHDPANPTIAYISDGTSTIYSVETNNYEGEKQVFKVIGSVQVKLENGDEVRWLNELEWANGYLYANIWQYSRIVKIDVKTGTVVKDLDFTYLGNHARSTAIAKFEGFNLELGNHCLNGIAWLEKDGYQGSEGSFLLTGKMWPTVYLIKFVEKK